jgi:hypothetical protein
MNDQSYRNTFLSRANLYCFLFLAFPTLFKNEILHQQLWGYKVEWRSVSRGTGGKKVEYHCLRETGCEDLNWIELASRFLDPLNKLKLVAYHTIPLKEIDVV